LVCLDKGRFRAFANDPGHANSWGGIAQYKSGKFEGRTGYAVSNFEFFDCCWDAFTAQGIDDA
jgi:hypothetical protein